MRFKIITLVLGMFLLIVPAILPGMSIAYELPQVPGEPTAAFDLRQAADTYNQDWIERAHAIYMDRHAGSLDSAYIYLVLAIVVLLAAMIFLSAKINGLDRHLRTFSGDQFRTALRLWMFRRWGARA